MPAMPKAKPVGNRTGRRGHYPAHQPTDATRKQVEALASYGVPQDDIAKVIGISALTLRGHYAEVLATASIKANSMVAQSLFNKATRGALPPGPCGLQGRRRGGEGPSGSANGADRVHTAAGKHGIKTAFDGVLGNEPARVAVGAVNQKVAHR